MQYVNRLSDAMIAKPVEKYVPYDITFRVI